MRLVGVTVSIETRPPMAETDIVVSGILTRPPEMLTLLTVRKRHFGLVRNVRNNLFGDILRTTNM